MSGAVRPALEACEDRAVRPQTKLGDLVDVSRARTLLIQDVWTGYSDVAPIAAVYQLRRSPSGGLIGEGVLSTAIAKPKRVPVSMKSATAKAFLDALVRSPLMPGPYEPYQDHTDDYPKIEIFVQVPPADIGDRGGTALLYTGSQGEYYAPWAAFVGGKAYVVEGDEVGRALQALDRPLKKAVLRRMMR